MNKSEVFFSDMRGFSDRGMLHKLSELYKKCDVGAIIEKGDIVAVKAHFGEMGNTSFIPSYYYRKIVDLVASQGGKPFLTDSNTLYLGMRGNAADHIVCAAHNGFSLSTVGAPIIIADGLLGRDYEEVTVEGKHFREVKIGSAVHHADALIVMSHLTGHELSGFGAAIKNVGMGIGSRAGKQEMHSDIKPEITASKCRACGKCVEWCPEAAITITTGKKEEKNGYAKIDFDKCSGCGECTAACRFEAIEIRWGSDTIRSQEKICEYTKGVLDHKKGKTAFFNFLFNMSPVCDCWNYSDAPFVPDIGMMASKDIVSIDQASADLVNETVPSLMNSRIRSRLKEGDDKFKALYSADWKVQLSYAEGLGLGSRQYDLIRIK